MTMPGGLRLKMVMMSTNEQPRWDRTGFYCRTGPERGAGRNLHKMHPPLILWRLLGVMNRMKQLHRSYARRRRLGQSCFFLSE